MTALVVADRHAVDDDIVRVDHLHGPEARAAKLQTAAHLHVRGVIDNDQARALAVVVGGPAQALGVVDLAERPVAVPPDLAVTIDRAFSGDGRVLLLVDVDQRGRPGHLDAGHTRGPHRVVFEVLGANEGHAFVDLQRHAGLHEERTGEISSRGKRHRAAVHRSRIDRPLDCAGVHRCAIRLGAVWGNRKRHSSRGKRQSKHKQRKDLHSWRSKGCSRMRFRADSTGWKATVSIEKKFLNFDVASERTKCSA